MPVIPLVPSDSPTLISSLLRLSAHNLALAASVLQPLKSGILSLYLSVPVPVPYLPSSPQDSLLPTGLPIHLTPLLLRLGMRFGIRWPLRVYKLYLLTYLHTIT